MDSDKSLNISYDEWRDYLLLAPSTDLHDILKFWRHSTVCSLLIILCNFSKYDNILLTRKSIIEFFHSYELLCCYVVQLSQK